MRISVSLMRASRFVSVVAMLTLSVGSLLGKAPSPPRQPKSGPGGADYAHASFQLTEGGEGGEQYWLYEPAKPAVAKAPLVIFLHGYSAMTPESYRDWIVHLVRKGSIVIYPRYQANLLTPAADYHANTEQAIRDALLVLGSPGHTAPDLDRIAVVGHSAGGVGAVTYAARATEDKLPIPRAVMTVCAGQGPSPRVTLVPLDDYSKIPADTRLLVMTAADDQFVRDLSSRRIWTRTEHLKDRLFVTMQSDTHGAPKLHANHLSPLAADHLSTDALDWRGYWRLFDQLCGDTFSGKVTPIDSSMGRWSDGTAVKPLLIERGTPTARTEKDKSAPADR